MGRVSIFYYVDTCLTVLRHRVHCSGEVKLPVSCEDGLWLELAQDLIQWQPLMLVVFNQRISGYVLQC